MRCIIIIVKSLLHFNLKICAWHIHWKIHEPAHWYAISRSHTLAHMRKVKNKQTNKTITTQSVNYHMMYDATGDLGGLLGSELSSRPLLSSSKRNCALQHFKTRTPAPLSIYKVSLRQRGCLWICVVNDTVVLDVVDNAMGIKKK